MIENSPSVPIELSAYDVAWPEQFQAEKAVLEQGLSPWLAGPIEHVGSTAVPGLIAKPVIDIMVAVEGLQASKPAIQKAEALGYCYWPYKANVMHWFCKPSDEYRTHHLHLVPFASELWQARIGFRDALIRDRQLADEYAKLKTGLAKQHRNDREAYTEGKTEFIKQALELSLR